MIDWTPGTLFTARLRSRILTDHQTRLLIALAANACWSDPDGMSAFATVRPADLRADAALGRWDGVRAMRDLQAMRVVTELHRFKSGLTSYGVDLRNAPARVSLPPLPDEAGQVESETIRPDGREM